MVTRTNEEKEIEQSGSSPQSMEVKIVGLDGWEPWEKAREYANVCRNAHNLKSMTKVEEERNALIFSLNEEAKNGWVYAGYIAPHGTVFVRHTDNPKYPTLEELFAGEETNEEWKKRVKELEEE